MPNLPFYVGQVQNVWRTGINKLGHIHWNRAGLGSHEVFIPSNYPSPLWGRNKSSKKVTVICHPSINVKASYPTSMSPQLQRSVNPSKAHDKIFGISQYDHGIHRPGRYQLSSLTPIDEIYWWLLVTCISLLFLWLYEDVDRINLHNGVLNWLENYLSDRYQSSRVNGVDSDMMMVECGVPQGSILGPLIFVMYINSLPDSLQNIDTYL